GMERKWKSDPSVDRTGRLDHGALHAAARGHVHVPLARERELADLVGTIRADHRRRAWAEVRSGARSRAVLRSRRTDEERHSRTVRAPHDERRGAAEADESSGRSDVSLPPDQSGGRRSRDGVDDEREGANYLEGRGEGWRRPAAIADEGAA